MDPATIEDWVRAWIEREHPRQETTARMGGGGAGRVEAALVSVDSVIEEGEVFRVRFTWGLVRESEFTVHESGGDGIAGRRTSEVRFRRDGQVLEDR